jgi:Uma2 family endonuclease
LKLKENRPDVATNPLLIVEVLSPSTEAYDRGKKFRKYREIESFTDYLLVSQEEPSVDHYHKREDGVWTVIGAYGMDGSLYLSSLDVTLPLSEVYDKITFPPPRPFPEEVRMGYDPPTDAEKHPK